MKENRRETALFTIAPDVVAGRASAAVFSAGKNSRRIVAADVAGRGEEGYHGNQEHLL